ncbi:MAG: O-antigen ligase family protein [Planctomycetota bacterium]
MLLVSAPLLAGCRPPWALGLYSILFLAWFTLFLVPQYVRGGIGGRPFPAVGLILVGAWALVQGFAAHPAFSGSIDWPSQNILSANPWKSLQQGETFLVAAVIFAGAAWLVKSSDRIRAMLLALAISGTLQSVVAISLASGDNDAMSRIAAWLPLYHTAATAVRGTYSNQDRFAALLLLYLPCLVGLWVSTHFTSWRRDGPPSFRMITRNFSLTASYSLYWLGITVTAAALFLTGCRTAAVILGLSALVLMAIYGRKVLMRRRGFVMMLVVALLLIVQQVIFGFQKVTDRLASLPLSWNMRVTGWGYATELIGLKPITGWGAGAFGDAAPHLPDYQSPLVWNHAHNQYLQYATGLGIPAALVLLACLVWWSHEVVTAMHHLRSRRRVYMICVLWAVVSILAVGLVDVPFYEPATLWILTALMGVAWGVAARPNEPLSPDETPPSLLSWQQAHAAGSAPTERSVSPAPRWLLGVLPLLGLAASVPAALILYGGMQETQIRSLRDNDMAVTDDHWDTLLAPNFIDSLSAYPDTIAAQVGLERHLHRPISPIDQLFMPEPFSPGLPPDALESSYRIRSSVYKAIQVTPFNGELYFYLAYLDVLQRMPPASKAQEVLPTLNAPLLRTLLHRLEPKADSATRAQWDALDSNGLLKLAQAEPPPALEQAMIDENIVLPRQMDDWRVQALGHLKIASSYSRGFARMQLFCGLTRLHLWSSQGTGEAELERGMQELRIAFEQDSGLLRSTMPELSFIGLSTAQIDQTIPDVSADHRIASDVYRAWGEYDDALRHLEQVDDDPMKALLEGDLEMQLGNTAKAIGCFQQYIDQDPPSDITLRANHVFEHWGTVVPDQALAFWKQQALKYPNLTIWNKCLGITYNRLGDTVQAFSYLLKASDSDDSAEVELQLAELSGNLTVAISHLRRATELAPDSIWLRAYLVLNLKAANDPSYMTEKAILRDQAQDFQTNDGGALPPEVQLALQGN